jgi:hypothetical protein
MSGGKVRLAVNLGPEDDTRLKEYARRKGITVTEAVTRAAAVLARISAAQEAGTSWVVIEPDGSSRQVEFLL